MVKTLAEVKKYTEVDGNDISKCVYWLINERQKADGSFLETSTYKPTKLMVIPTHRQQMFKYACAMLWMCCMYIQCYMYVVSVEIQSFSVVFQCSFSCDCCWSVMGINGNAKTIAWTLSLNLCLWSFILLLLLFGYMQSLMSVYCRVLELTQQNRQFTSHPSLSLESRMPWRFQNVNLRYFLEHFNMCHTDDIQSFSGALLFS